MAFVFDLVCELGRETPGFLDVLAAVTSDTTVVATAVTLLGAAATLISVNKSNILATGMSTALVPPQQTCDSFLPVAEMSKALVHVPPLTGTCEAPGVCEAITSASSEVFSLSPQTLLLGAAGIVGVLTLCYFLINRKEEKTEATQETPEKIEIPVKNDINLELLTQLDAFSESLTHFIDYEVSPSTQLALKKHQEAINTFKADLKTSEPIDKSQFHTGKTLLIAALDTMEKTSFQTRGGIGNEKSSLLTGYTYLVACARQAFNLFTQLFAKLGLVSHKDVANPIAKTLLGQSFFFQVSPTQEENKLIESSKQTLVDASTEISQLKPLAVG